MDTVMQHYNVSDMPFNFKLLTSLGPECHTGACLQDVVRSSLDAVPKGKWANWVVGNHDNHRVASKVGRLYVNAINALLLLLPGTPTTYYGEEIGMLNVNVTFNQSQDPWGIYFGPVCRTLPTIMFNDNYV